jgi:TIR domain
MIKRVFISYRRDPVGKSFAQLVNQVLTNRGYDAFLDVQSLTVGGDWKDQIAEEIRNRRHFLLLLTPESLVRCNDNEDVLRWELEEAKRNNRNIVPIRQEDFDLASIPDCIDWIRRIQFFDLPHKNPSVSIEDLCNRLEGSPSHNDPQNFTEFRQDSTATELNKQVPFCNSVSSKDELAEPEAFKLYDPFSVKTFLENSLLRIVKHELHTFRWFDPKDHARALAHFRRFTKKRSIVLPNELELPTFVTGRNYPQVLGYGPCSFPKEFLDSLVKKPWRIACPAILVGSAAIIFGIRRMFPEVEVMADFSATQAVDFCDRIKRRLLLTSSLPPDVIIGGDGLLLEIIKKEFTTDIEYELLQGSQPLLVSAIGRRGIGSGKAELPKEPGVFRFDMLSENTLHLWWKRNKSKSDFAGWKAVHLECCDIVRWLTEQNSMAMEEFAVSYELYAAFAEFSQLGEVCVLPNESSGVTRMSEGFMVCDRSHDATTRMALFAMVQSVLKAFFGSNPQFLEETVKEMIGDQQFINVIENALGWQKWRLERMARD